MFCYLKFESNFPSLADVAIAQLLADSTPMIFATLPQSIAPTPAPSPPPPIGTTISIFFKFSPKKFSISRAIDPPLPEIMNSSLKLETYSALAS